METVKIGRVRHVLQLLYARPRPQARWQREGFHVGFWFDVIVFITLVLAFALWCTG